jgi:hypothetical protein
MNKDNILKYIVPVVAVVVLVESVVLISRLKDKVNTPKIDDKEPQTETTQPVTESAVYKVTISGDKAAMKVGDSQDVRVSLSGQEDRALDSVNVYVKYDPNAVEVTGMTFDKRLPMPAFSKVSTLRGLLVANFLISDPKGLTLAKGEDLMLMGFKMKALKPGAQSFEISTGKEMKESATMIVENETSKPLSFSSNKLTVNVTE